MTVLRDFLLAFADDEHLMGQQHTEWIGVTPFLEEDLAFSSIGQDELGHAALLYELVLDIDGVKPSDTAIDALAFGRAPEAYRSSALAEHPTTEWSEALVRHWIYDAAEQLRWQNVKQSAHEPLAELVQRVEREEVFHRRHADALLDPLLAHGEAAARIQTALDQLLPLASTALAPVQDEAELVASGVLQRRSDHLVADLAARVAHRFDREVTLAPASPGRLTRSDAFAPLLSRMREVFDLDLNAVW